MTDRNAQLQQIRNQHQQKAERMVEIVDHAEREERNLSNSESREYDRLESDCKRLIDDEQKVLRQMGVGSDPAPASGGRWYRDESGRELRAYPPGEQINQGEGPTFGSFVAGAIRSAHGIRLSERERRALEAATGSSGGYLVDEQLSARFIDALRARSVVSRAGALTLPLTGSADRFHLARIDSDPTPEWRAENATVAEGDPTFSRIMLGPKTLAVLTKIPSELVQDAANLEMVVERSLTESVAAEIDRAAIFGSGVGDEPMGLIHTQNVNVEAVGGALMNYDPFVKGLRRLEDDNVDSSAPTVAAVMAPRDWQTIELFKDTTNQPLRPPPSVAGLTRFRSTKVPTDGGTGSNESEIVTGDWSRVLLGVRQEVTVEILRELFRERLQIGVLVWARFDVALERGESFVRLSGITP